MKKNNNKGIVSGFNFFNLHAFYADPMNHKEKIYIAIDG